MFEEKGDQGPGIRKTLVLRQVEGDSSTSTSWSVKKKKGVWRRWGGGIWHWKSYFWTGWWRKKGTQPHQKEQEVFRGSDAPLPGAADKFHPRTGRQSGGPEQRARRGLWMAISYRKAEGEGPGHLWWRACIWQGNQALAQDAARGSRAIKVRLQEDAGDSCEGFEGAGPGRGPMRKSLSPCLDQPGAPRPHALPLCPSFLPRSTFPVSLPNYLFTLWPRWPLFKKQSNCPSCSFETSPPDTLQRGDARCN